MKLLYSTSKLFLLVILITSCTTSKEIPLLVSMGFLSNLDSIKLESSHKITDLTNNGIGYSNLPMKLRNKRNSKKVHKAWDEIVNKYKSESNFYIDTINTKIIVQRRLTKWLFENNKRLEKQITIDDFKGLLIKDGIKSNDYEIKRNIVSEFDDGYKQLVLELWYKGTVNYITIGENNTIKINTFLKSQIHYWESQGYQFSTTTKETIEKYSKNKK